MYFDKDGSGYIELDELQEALADESGVTDADVVNEIMREVDADKVWHLTLAIVSQSKAKSHLFLLLLFTNMILNPLLRRCSNLQIIFGTV